MKSNSHLSLEERSKISVLQSSGESVRSIARILGRSPSTISRELNRTQADKFRGNYIASTTHARVQELWKKSHKSFTYVGTGRNIPNRIDISLRNELANERLEFGHFEADSVVSCTCKGKTKSCLTVLVDRATRYTLIRKTASKTSLLTSKSILDVMKPYQNTIKSITYDNGCEFSQNEKINKELNIKSYFCKPYHSWEKGTVENINGLIRRFFPKGTDFDTITEEQIAYVEDWINNRPMKILHYMTPKQKLQHFGVAIAS